MSDAEKRDGCLLLLIAAAFGVLASVAAVIGGALPFDASWGERSRAGDTLSITCGIAAFVLFAWSLVKFSREAVTRVARKHFRLSRRRLVVHVLLALTATAATHCFLLWSAIYDGAVAVDACRNAGILWLTDRAPGYGYLSFEPLDDKAASFRLIAVNGIVSFHGGALYSTAAPLRVEIWSAERTANPDWPCTTWYEWRATSQALERSAHAAAKLGWTVEALRRELDACRAEAARLDELPPGTCEPSLDAAKAFPGVSLVLTPAGNELADVQLKRWMGARVVSGPAPRVRVDGKRLWVRAGGEDVALVDAERGLIICASTWRMVWPEPREPYQISLPACLFFIAAAWLALLAPFCYLRRKASPPRHEDTKAPRPDDI